MKVTLKLDLLDIYIFLYYISSLLDTCLPKQMQNFLPMHMMTLVEDHSLSVIQSSILHRTYILGIYHPRAFEVSPGMIVSNL